MTISYSRFMAATRAIGDPNDGDELLGQES